MSNLILDRYALGLDPDWPDIILQICDLELNLITNPRQRRICVLMLEGFSQRETATKMGLHHRQVEREIGKIRQLRRKS
jgi:hypothetical protein